MVKRDVIVIGASAGGVEALQQIVADLPGDLPAAVFVVIHLLPGVRSDLPEILSRAGPLKAIHPVPGQDIQRGRIYVAPPDHHLIVEGNSVHLWKGPKENRHRPAINPLFRSAAVAFGRRVAGVILSGCMDDGSAGLWQVKRSGGVAIVQDPGNAMFPDMIVNAIQYVQVDRIAELSEMGSLLTGIALGISGDGAPKLHIPDEVV